FGSIKPTVIKRENVPEPSFQKGAPVGFHDLSIPTAYIRIKFNSKSVTDREAVATNLMIKILDEELSEEIRTKRSLSYSVYSYALQFDMGLGVIGASTSKPEETLAAIGEVIE